jgi:signal recognition particle receptor subunit beta
MFDVQEELSKLLFEEKLLGCSVLIFGNKQDLKNKLTMDEISKKLDLKKYENRNIKIFECRFEFQTF